MKEHFCLVEHSVLSFQGQCNWCDEKESTQPRRPWVRLTNEEISACSKGHMTRNGFARAVEAKLKELNT